MNYHTLADFRVEYEAELDDLLTQSVAALMSEGMVSLEKTAQDGIRIRASAGASSFRRKPSLDECLRKAQAVVEAQKAKLEDGERDQRTQREKAAQQRHAQERLERVKKALEEVEKVAAKREKNRETRRKKRPARASTSDPEARVMKMADGGFRSNPGIEQAAEKGIAVFSPIPTRYSGNNQKRPEEI